MPGACSLPAGRTAGSVLSGEQAQESIVSGWYKRCREVLWEAEAIN